MRILIVDDEPYIVDGLVGLLEETELADLEICSAYSSREALELLNMTKIDIVLSDIHMPGMNGLELQKRIRKQWPRCRIIFLTGHMEFEYAKEAIRYQADDYVLKTDGDQAILRAIYKAIEVLKLDVELETFLEAAKRQLRSALPKLQKDFLLDILQGRQYVGKHLSEQLNEIMIPLNGEEPIFLVQGRIDYWAENLSRADRTLLLYAVQNVANEYLQPGTSFISFDYDDYKLLWILQPPRVESDEETADVKVGRMKRFIRGHLEPIQATCKSLLKLSMSLVYAANPVEWNRLPDQFEALNLMFQRSYGMGEELIIEEGAFHGKDLSTLSTSFVRMTSNRILNLHTYLESGQQNPFEEELREYLLDPAWNTAGDNMKMMAFYQLVALFMSNLMRSDLVEAVNSVLDLKKLTRYDNHHNWEEVVMYFFQLSEILFHQRLSRVEKQGSDFVDKIKRYIDGHTSGDLSLTRLGEVVALNASYLSRMFKHFTGENLTEYILEIRLAKAKSLLKETNLQVQEITKAIGFESPAYFIRIFKKSTQLTPQQYREQCS